MAMNQWLAEMYGTNGAQETMDKTAELELFAKLAADNGIDLTQLSPQQVSELYAETFGKTAQEDEGSEEDEEEDKKEEALKEHEEAKEGAAKVAEADMMGRVMAHALVNELDEIEKQAGGAGKAGVGRLSRLGQWAKGQASAAGEKARGAGKYIAEKERAAAGATSRALGAKAGKGGKTPLGRGRAAMYGGAGLAAAGGTAAAMHKKKESSALDEFAAVQAVKTAAAAGWDAEEAGELIGQALDQGAFEGSEKIAYVENTGDAIHVRGLEMLESVGYPVNWEEVFGG
jgi:hypothetical protein